MAQDTFNLLGAQTYKGYNETGHITPNFEYSEGIRPAGSFVPAAYLPVVRYNEYFREWIVVSAGKVVAFDSKGAVVPAGLRLEAATYKTNLATSVAAADAGATIKYTVDDVRRGVKNAKGVLVVAGEPVVKSWFTGTTQDLFVSAPIGVASYNYWIFAGGDGENPAQFNIAGWNLQNKVAFVCDYQLEYPLVQDAAAYAAAAFTGIAAFIGAAGTVKPGMFVSYDTNSNFVSVGYAYGATPAENIIGQVTSVVEGGPINMLDKVRSPNRALQFGTLEALSGTATNGMPDTVTYANGYGLVRLNLQNR